MQRGNEERALVIPVNSERWKQVDKLLQAALERPAAARSEFLRQACMGDQELEREVRSLLAAQHEAESFLERPAIEVAARAIAGKQSKDAQESRCNPLSAGCTK